MPVLPIKFSLKIANTAQRVAAKIVNSRAIRIQLIMKRNATAVWHGSLKEGNGVLTTQSKVLDNSQYSFKTRFEGGIGTNPEELVAAAHAGCFTMQLSAYLTEAGYEIESLETRCDIVMESGTITNSDLNVTGKIQGITATDFEEQVKKAEQNCPISRLLNAKITAKATLA